MYKVKNTFDGANQYTQNLRSAQHSQVVVTIMSAKMREREE